MKEKGKKYQHKPNINKQTINYLKFMLILRRKWLHLSRDEWLKDWMNRCLTVASDGRLRDGELMNLIKRCDDNWFGLRLQTNFICETKIFWLSMIIMLLVNWNLSLIVLLTTSFDVIIIQWLSFDASLASEFPMRCFANRSKLNKFLHFY